MNRRQLLKSLLLAPFLKLPELKGREGWCGFIEYQLRPNDYLFISDTVIREMQKWSINIIDNDVKNSLILNPNISHEFSIHLV